MFNKSTYVTNFGLEFQTNAGIVLMLNCFEDMKAIKLKGNYEDIDNGEMVQMENFVFELLKSIITIVCGVITGVILFLWQEKSKRRNEQKRLIHALHAEVTTLIEFLDKQHNHVKIDGKETFNYTYYIKVDKSYCKIYDENVGKIGLLANEKLIKELVNAYTLTKILFDELQDQEFVAKREINYNIQHPDCDKVLERLQSDRKKYLVQIYYESLEVKKKLALSQKLLREEFNKFNDWYSWFRD